MTSTVGQILINEALPPDMRDYERVWDKKGLQHTLGHLAMRHPEAYREVSKKLSDLGWRASQETGGFSVKLAHMKKSPAAIALRQQLEAQLNQLLDDDRLDDKQRNAAIVKLVGSHMKPAQEAVFEEALKAGNPLAQQVKSGASGNKMNLSSMLGADMLYADHRDQVIPVPVLRSYSEGLTPAEYWAGTYGARKGVIDLKYATQDAGFLSKQLNQVTHRLVVTDLDGDGEPDVVRGMPTSPDDADNEGSLLAADAGPYKRNSVLTPKILKHLTELGHKRILVRSPIIGGSPEGGIYARDVGVREHGNLPGRGEMPGLAAVQAMSEPLTQAQISSKHTGGVASEGAAISGFDYINQLVQVSKSFKGSATHAQRDGIVTKLEPAPAGGWHLTVDGHSHYVPAEADLKVKVGDRVEAGDVLSSGLPNPAEIVKHKGIGEGRRAFVDAFRDAMTTAGIKSSRRNIELLARGLINHVRLDSEIGNYVPDDVVPYSTLEHLYQPRADARELPVADSLNKYLEKPILHYTIGTRVRPSVLKDLSDFGVAKVTVHDQPPGFSPEMIRGMYSLQNDPDWMTRMYGSGLKGGLLKAVHRGAVSNEEGTSFVPSLARSVDFGHTALIHTPEPGFPVKTSAEKTANFPRQAAASAGVTPVSHTPGQTSFSLVPPTSKAPASPKPPAAPASPYRVAPQAPAAPAAPGGTAQVGTQNYRAASLPGPLQGLMMQAATQLPSALQMPLVLASLPGGLGAMQTLTAGPNNHAAPVTAQAPPAAPPSTPAAPPAAPASAAPAAPAPQPRANLTPTSGPQQLNPVQRSYFNQARQQAMDALPTTLQSQFDAFAQEQGWTAADKQQLWPEFQRRATADATAFWDNAARDPNFMETLVRENAGATAMVGPYAGRWQPGSDWLQGQWDAQTHPKLNNLATFGAPMLETAAQNKALTWGVGKLAPKLVPGVGPWYGTISSTPYQLLERPALLAANELGWRPRDPDSWIGKRMDEASTPQSQFDFTPANVAAAREGYLMLRNSTPALRALTKLRGAVGPTLRLRPSTIGPAGTGLASQILQGSYVLADVAMNDMDQYAQGRAAGEHGVLNAVARGQEMDRDWYKDPNKSWYQLLGGMNVSPSQAAQGLIGATERHADVIKAQQAAAGSAGMTELQTRFLQNQLEQQDRRYQRALAEGGVTVPRRTGHQDPRTGKAEVVGDYLTREQVPEWAKHYERVWQNGQIGYRRIGGDGTVLPEAQMQATLAGLAKAAPAPAAKPLAGPNFPMSAAPAMVDPQQQARWELQQSLRAHPLPADQAPKPEQPSVPPYLMDQIMRTMAQQSSP